MSEPTCPNESAVVAAVRGGIWSGELRTHVAGCAECGIAARVAGWMGNMAVRLARNQALPDPTYLWLKAEIERRGKEASAVSRLRLSLLALLSLTAGLASAAALLAVLPRVSAAADGATTWLLVVAASADPQKVAVLGTVWLGFPLLLVMTYLLVFRAR